MTILTIMTIIYARTQKKDVIPLGLLAIVQTIAQWRMKNRIGKHGLPALQGLR